MNGPPGNHQNKRLRSQAGPKAADFPEAFIVDEPLRKELGKHSALTRAQRDLVRCAATRRLWASARRAEAGYQMSALCEACEEEPGTIRHVLYRCPATAAARHHRNLGPVEVTGSRSSVEHHLFTRGCMPDLRCQAARPVTEEIVE